MAEPSALTSMAWLSKSPPGRSPKPTRPGGIRPAEGFRVGRAAGDGRCRFRRRPSRRHWRCWNRYHRRRCPRSSPRLTMPPRQPSSGKRADPTGGAGGADDDRAVGTDAGAWLWRLLSSSRPPRPTMPEAAVQRNASLSKADLLNPTTTEPSALTPLAGLSNGAAREVAQRREAGGGEGRRRRPAEQHGDEGRQQNGAINSSILCHERVFHFWSAVQSKSHRP